MEEESHDQRMGEADPGAVDDTCQGWPAEKSVGDTMEQQQIGPTKQTTRRADEPVRPRSVACVRNKNIVRERTVAETPDGAQDAGVVRADTLALDAEDFAEETAHFRELGCANRRGRLQLETKAILPKCM